MKNKKKHETLTINVKLKGFNQIKKLREELTHLRKLGVKKRVINSIAKQATTDTNNWEILKKYLLENSIERWGFADVLEKMKEIEKQ